MIDLENLQKSVEALSGLIAVNQWNMYEDLELLFSRLEYNGLRITEVSYSERTDSEIGDYMVVNLAFGERETAPVFVQNDAKTSATFRQIVELAEKSTKVRCYDAKWNFDYDRNLLQITLHGKRNVIRDARYEKTPIILALNLGSGKYTVPIDEFESEEYTWDAFRLKTGREADYDNG